MRLPSLPGSDIILGISYKPPYGYVVCDSRADDEVTDSFDTYINTCIRDYDWTDLGG
jgi:hypothetical protein